MKRLLFVFCMLCVCFSCENPQDQRVSDAPMQRVGTSELSYAIEVTVDTDYLTTMFLRMGVDYIDVTETVSQITYDVRSVRHFALNTSDVDFGGYTFVFDGTYLKISGVTGYSVKMLSGDLYLQSPNYTGNMANITSTTIIDNTSAILLAFTNELITPNSSKLRFSASLSAGTGCSIFDTYYYYGTGFSASVAQNNLQTAISTIGTSGCTSIGGVDTSCVTSAHLCFATQAYCCP